VACTGNCQRVCAGGGRSDRCTTRAKVLLDLAITTALGEACADIAVLRAQPGVFGPVASDPTVSRTIDRLALAGEEVLGAIRTARVAARAWVQRTGPPLHDGRVTVDMDATLIMAHSEKEHATKTWKKTFGHHPLLGFVDHRDGGTGEPVAGRTAAAGQRGQRSRNGSLSWGWSSPWVPH
jgi:hypothetical protein